MIQFIVGFLLGSASAMVGVIIGFRTANDTKKPLPAYKCPFDKENN